MSNDSGGSGEQYRGEQLRCSLPDTVIGIGGAGKKVVYRMMETDWIIREAIEPRDDDQFPGMKAFVVDTDQSQADTHDRPRTERINGRIDRIAEDLGRNSQNLSTELEYINPLENTSPEYKTGSELTARGPVNSIADQNGLKAWWLSENEHMLTQDDSYEDGVLRRRALSKALFHASRVQGDPFNELLTPTDESVAIVVGLGGGTGSGMFLDIAKWLDRDIANVDVFGIIPSTQEKERVRANAHAALSELEYLSITDQSPFRNVVLLPFGPAKELFDAENFDESVVNTIVAHQNMGSNQRGTMDPSSGSDLHAYAPFTIAAPQTLRFAVGNTQQARNSVESYIDGRLRELEARHELYDALEEYVLSEFEGEHPADCLEDAIDGIQPSDEQFSLSSEQATPLRDELDRVVEVLDLDIFGQLGYEAANDWHEDLQSRIRNEEQSLEDLSQTERKDMVVTNVPLLADKEQDVGDVYPREERNQRLARLVRRELMAIYREATLYKTAKLLDEELKEGIKLALDSDTTAVAGGHDLSRRLRRTGSDLEALETDIECLDAFLNKDRTADLDVDHAEDIEGRIDDEKSKWRGEAYPIVERIVRIDGNEQRLSTLLSDLEVELEDAVERINETRDPDAIDEDPLYFDSFDELNDLLVEVGMDRISVHGINDSVKYAARAKKAWLRAQQRRESVVWSIAEQLGLDNTYSEQRTEFNQSKAEIDESIIEIPETFDRQFDCSFVGRGRYESLIEDVESRREQTIDELVSTFESALYDARTGVPEAIRTQTSDGTPKIDWSVDVSEFPETLRRELSGDASSRSVEAILGRLCDGAATADGNVVHRAFEARLAGPVRERKEQLREELDSIRADRQRYQALIDIIENEGAHITDFEDVDERPETNFELSSDEEYTYIQQVAATDPSSMLNDDDIVEAGLWNEETTMIRGTLRRFAESINGFDDLMPLNDPRPRAEDSDLSSLRYQQHRLLTVFMSRAFDSGSMEESDMFGEVEESLREGVYVPDGDQGSYTGLVGFGAPWDISMVTFVTGVVIDNITPVTTDNGYWMAYHDQRDTLRENVRVRHTHGLDGLDDLIASPGEGAFVTRERLLNFNTPEDLDRLIGGTEDEVISLVRDDLQQVTNFESTIDIDGVTVTDPGSVTSDDA